MRGSALVAIGIIAATSLWACSTARPRPRASSASSDQPGLMQQGNAVVLTSGLLHQDSQSLLDVLQHHLPNIHVNPTASCPEVYLRGRSSISGPSNATIYVNGQRAADSCILSILYGFDLDRVEVYPMGVTSRPGYFSDPDGLILVFLRRADQQ